MGAARPSSPWTALLESLHSALIDEVTERHPEPKPELGLPVRQSRFAIPSPAVEELLLTDVTFTEARGIALLAFQREFMRSISLKPTQFWDSILRRATPEFKRRQIQPRLSPTQELGAHDPFPASTLHCARVIWIPIRLPSGECFLGVGV